MSYRTRDQRIADEVSDSYLECPRCKKQTLTATLSQYGARCLACYESYLAQVPGKEHFTLAEKRALRSDAGVLTVPAEPKAWAYALKTRAENGERLSAAQKTMCRAALGRQAEPA